MRRSQRRSQGVRGVCVSPELRSAAKHILSTSSASHPHHCNHQYLTLAGGTRRPKKARLGVAISGKLRSWSLAEIILRTYFNFSSSRENPLTMIITPRLLLYSLPCRPSAFSLLRSYPRRASLFKLTPQFACRTFAMTPPTKLGKRLIVSCDGTWQSADTGPANDPTNAINFCRALTHNAQGDRMEQIVFYQAGVATGGVLPIQKALAGVTSPLAQYHFVAVLI